MRSRLPHLPAAALALLALAACADTREPAAPFVATPAYTLVNGPPVAVCGAPTSVRLLTNRTVHAGRVEVVNDDVYLYVTYRTDAAWPIGKTALFVGDDPLGIPTSGGGNPQVGMFPYRATHPAGQHEVTWRVPLNEAGTETAIVASFAELGADLRGAWAEGTQIGGRGSWAAYFEYAIAKCGTRVDPDEGETVTVENVTLVVPQNSLQDPVFITIEPVTGPVPQAPQAIAGAVFDFGPDGLQFATPAALTLKYPPGASANAVRPFGIIDGVLEILPIISITDDEVTFNVHHFSIYGLLLLTEADLAMTATASPNPARVGDQILFEAIVTNTGTPAATVESAVVMLTFSGLGFVRGDLPAGCEVEPEPGPNGEITFVCDIGPLEPGESLSLLIPANTLPFFGPGTIQFDALVLPDVGYEDAARGNNGDGVSVDVLPVVTADLRMKAFGPGPPRQAGLERTISATVENLGTSVDPVDAAIEFLFSDGGAASLEVIHDQLPAGCAAQSVSTHTTIHCPVGTLQPGEEAMRQVVVRPLQARLYPVKATGLPLAGDPNTGNNAQSGAFESLPTSLDLATQIVTNHAEVDVGGSIIFQARANHLSGDLLPQGTLRIEIEGDASLVTGQAGCEQIEVFPFALAFNCPLPQLEAGQNSPVQLITVAAQTGGTDITAHARLLLPAYVVDTDPNNNASQATTTVRPDNLVDFEVDAFFASTATAKPFEHVTFTANAELLSASSTPVSGAELVVTVEGSSLGVVSVIEPTCGVSALLFDAGFEMRCPLDNMVTGEVRVFSITVSKSTAPGDISATATIEVPAELQESDPDNNTASTDVAVAPFVADVNLSLIGDTPDPVDAGEVITYEVFAQSATDSDALPLVTVRFLAVGDVELVSLPAGIDIACQHVTSSNLADVVVLCEISNHEWQNARHLTYGIRAVSGPFVNVEAQIFPVPSTTHDPDPSNNVRNQQTTVNDAADELIGSLVFASNRVNMNDLFTKDLDTGVITRITDTSDYSDPEWDTDGLRVAAVWGTTEIHVMDADGGNRVDYDVGTLFNVLHPQGPSWSPDGTRIVFSAIPSATPEVGRELWVLDLDTDEVTRITTNTTTDEYPDWSADDRIAYTADGRDLITIDPDGSNPVTVLGPTSVNHPAWSPDGRFIAFASVRPAGFAIRVVDVANPFSIITVADDDATNLKPAWSPDGAFIAFARAQAGSADAFDLFYKRSDGTGAAQVLEAVIGASTRDVGWK